MGTTSSSALKTDGTEAGKSATQTSRKRSNSGNNSILKQNAEAQPTISETSINVVVDSLASTRLADGRFFGFDGPSMSRSMTLDDRRMANAELRSFPTGPGMKKHVSFYTPRGNKVMAASTPAVHYDDVLYRRFFGDFGDGPNLKKAKSLVGIVPEIYEQGKAMGRERSEAVVVVDTFSTGAMLAYLLYHRGYKVICVLSGESVEKLIDIVPEGMDTQFLRTLVFDQKIDPAVALAKLTREISSCGVPVAAVMAGAETGVELADALSEYLGLRTNGTALSEARRNKYVMGEAVRAAGIRAVKQLYATKWSEIASFLEEWKPDPFKVIIKPVDSAGSEDVTLCLSLNEVQSAFNNIIGKINGLGIMNKAVLVQEYLEGTEYVVDTVSRDGEHKVVAIWEYDRRCVNGAEFVCFGQRLLAANEPRCGEMMAYMRSVLGALGINNGPAHGEVKWCRGEPVLVEVGARCHGLEGYWMPLADRAIGYNQANVATSAYLNKDAFDSIPAAPQSLKTNGRLMFFVSTVSGTLSEINPQYLAEIQSMDSFVNFEMFLKVGGLISKTINCFTFAGIVLLIHGDLETVLSDGDRIRAMEDSGLFCTADTSYMSSSN